MTGENASLIPEPGTLYVVATPIGNLADFTERAISILRKVDCIACEDTRSSSPLLKRFEIDRQLVAYHEHNEKSLAPQLADRLANGESIALISDAGTPAISDPGFRLVRECAKRKLKVCPVPGANAAIALLSASGLPTNGFLYVGFLPPKSAARKRFFEEHKDFKYSIVVYESCHRIEKFLNDAEETLGSDRTICLGREITKRFETIISGTIPEIKERMKTASKKGEFVVVIAPDGYEL